MSTTTFTWDPLGDDTQTFLVSNIREDTLDQISQSEYVLKDLEPGHPYMIQANVINSTTKEETSHEITDHLIWPSSNLSDIAFTREHGEFFTWTSTRDPGTSDTCTLHIQNDLHEDADVQDFTIMFDIFAETKDSTHTSVYSQTIEYPINTPNIHVDIHDLDPSQNYDIHTSLLVQPPENTHWYYVYAHEHQLEI